MKTELDPIISDVLDLHDLAPSDHVNAVMGSLVGGVVNGALTLDELEVTTIHRVRDISSRAESELETFWARLITEAVDPLTALQAFPYLNNYTELISRELSILEKAGLVLDTHSSILVIGSGPLPLSAYELFRQTGANVDQVDSMQNAVSLGNAVCGVLNMPTMYHHATGESVMVAKQYDLVLIAALAGDTPKVKQEIIDNVLPNIANAGRVIVRSAKGNRTLLYPAIGAKDIVGLRLLNEYHPNDYIINSVLVYGK